MNPAKIAEEIILNLLKSVLTEKYRGWGGKNKFGIKYYFWRKDVF